MRSLSLEDIKNNRKKRKRERERMDAARVAQQVDRGREPGISHDRAADRRRDGSPRSIAGRRNSRKRHSINYKAITLAWRGVGKR